MARTYTPHTIDVAATLGMLIAAGRRERRWTRAGLAERLGVSLPTVSKVERGDLSVGFGTVLEAAVLVGVPLFGADGSDRARVGALAEARLAMLPSRVRSTAVEVDDDF